LTFHRLGAMQLQILANGFWKIELHVSPQTLTYMT
jgi:hypothetical protein